MKHMNMNKNDFFKFENKLVPILRLMWKHNEGRYVGYPWNSWLSDDGNIPKLIIKKSRVKLLEVIYTFLK